MKRYSDYFIVFVKINLNELNDLHYHHTASPSSSHSISSAIIIVIKQQQQQHITIKSSESNIYRKKYTGYLTLFILLKRWWTLYRNKQFKSVRLLNWFGKLYYLDFNELSFSLNKIKKKSIYTVSPKKKERIWLCVCV